MEYLIATGYDVAADDMDPWIIQPQTPGMIPTRRQDAASGRVIDELFYVPLTWPLFETDDDYRAILTQCGLLVATTALVSVQVQDQNYDWVVRNAVAKKPQIGTDGSRQDMFLKGFMILLIKLSAQA